MKSIIEARMLTIKHLKPFLEKQGFNVKLNKGFEARIERKRENGLDTIGIGMLNYNPAFQIRYGFNKINYSNNEVLLKLQEVVKLDYIAEKKSRFLFFSYSTVNGLDEDQYLPYMESEADVEKCVGMMIDFMETTAFSLLDRFEDLKEVDKIVNGENPWETDWKMPYAFGGNFYEKRLILAKLTGNPYYESIVNFNYATLEKLSAESGHPFVYDRTDISKPLPVLIEILKEVKPLY